jgi:3-hydroxybutyrate dehydrogenase
VRWKRRLSAPRQARGASDRQKELLELRVGEGQCIALEHRPKRVDEGLGGGRDRDAVMARGHHLGAVVHCDAGSARVPLGRYRDLYLRPPRLQQAPEPGRAAVAHSRAVAARQNGSHEEAFVRQLPRPSVEHLYVRLRFAPVDERSAIVTGAASGIGRAIAQRLTEDGVRVLAVDLEPAEDGPGEPFATDLTTREGNRAAVDAARERFGGRIDAIVANAGFQHVDPIADFPEDKWDALIDLLLTSPFLLAKYAWPTLAAAPGGGRFIGIASAHGLVASPYKSAYVSAKHGLVGLVKTLALEGAEHGILATAVCPGFVRTPLVEAQIESQARAHDKPPDSVLEDVILAPHAVKRLIEPDEVANVVAFLMGDGGRAFSGVPVTMDLGWTAR